MLRQLGLQVLWQVIGILFLGIALGIVVNQVRSDGLSMVGDWSPEAQLAIEPGKTLVIGLDEAQQSFYSKRAVFLDARSPESYQEGHILGARNLPFEEANKYLNAAMCNIPKDSLIITYCDGEGCSLSKDLALELFYMGYDNVRELIDGWNLWKEHGLPTKKGTSPE